jgi:molybdenum cofactor cytidylyltransferase
MKNPIPITALVLAAGTSSRMGTFKPLLPLDGTPMLETVITKVLSFSFIEVMTVVGYKDKEIKESINIQDQRFKWVSNPNYLEGLSSSIKAAIHQYHYQNLGVMVFLGDQPLIKISTIEKMVQVINEMGNVQSKSIIQPAYNGMPGHPVFISSQMIPYLKTITGDQGAKLIFKHAEKHILIPTDDKGILFDVDTQQDYQKII